MPTQRTCSTLSQTHWSHKHQEVKTCSICWAWTFAAIFISCKFTAQVEGRCALLELWSHPHNRKVTTACFFPPLPFSLTHTRSRLLSLFLSLFVSYILSVILTHLSFCLSPAPFLPVSRVFYSKVSCSNPLPVLLTLFHSSLPPSSPPLTGVLWKAYRQRWCPQLLLKEVLLVQEENDRRLWEPPVIQNRAEEHKTLNHTVLRHKTNKQTNNHQLMTCGRRSQSNHSEVSSWTTTRFNPLRPQWATSVLSEHFHCQLEELLGTQSPSALSSSTMCLHRHRACQWCVSLRLTLLHHPKKVWKSNTSQRTTSSRKISNLHCHS